MVVVVEGTVVVVVVLFGGDVEPGGMEVVVVGRFDEDTVVDVAGETCELTVEGVVPWAAVDAFGFVAAGEELGASGDVHPVGGVPVPV